MKTLTLILFSALFIAASIASNASAQAPNDVQDFTSHGIHVILRTTNANQVIGAVLGFQGGFAYGETNNAAIAAGTAALISASGSDKYPKSAYRDSLAALSTTIAGSGSLYQMSFTLRTIRPSFNSAWNIFADLLTHPHYDTLEADKLREQAIKAIEGRDADPDSYSSFLADSLWKGTSRLNRVATVDEVNTLTLSDLMQYRNSQFQRSRMVLVVVGDVSRKELEAKLAALDLLPEGNFSWPKIEKITPVTDQFMFVPKPADFPTTYINMRAALRISRNPDGGQSALCLEFSTPGCSMKFARNAISPIRLPPMRLGTTQISTSTFPCSPCCRILLRTLYSMNCGNCRIRRYPQPICAMPKKGASQRTITSRRKICGKRKFSIPIRWKAAIGGSSSRSCRKQRKLPLPKFSKLLRNISTDSPSCSWVPKENPTGMCIISSNVR